MAKVKIKSNPYKREIEYYALDESTEQWIDVKKTDSRSRLRETDSERSFLPFKILEILNIIIDEYYVGRGKVELWFEGTQDEYDAVEKACVHEDICDKIELVRSKIFLENARFIKDEVKEIFERVNPVIENIMHDDVAVKRGLEKVSQALDDVIPLCVFGNYSAGKSTFINALMGVEVLPSGGDPVTTKIYEIRDSEQPDQAKISFKFHGEEIELSVENNEFRVLKGSSEASIIDDIKSEIDNNGISELYTIVRIAIDILNDYEKKNRETAELGSVISLTVPFSKNGIIGNSSNKFVIFDTPGSNSNSNQDHAKVLTEAMEGFSNGIPIWVTEYDAHDTKDNAELCDKVLAIESLDKRFTMIIFNKADDADLPEEGFSNKQIEEILEYRAIEKMYASGIFFVSSIMGLGGKTNGEFIDRFYRKTFRTQNPTFSDPEDIDYISLYKYNIMPELIKKNVIDYSSNTDNLVYANSGLYCVEKEIENFGSRHSSYNKCQMVFAFLSDVIEKTNTRIEEKTTLLKEMRAKSEQSLGEKTVKLRGEIERLSKTMADSCGKRAKTDINDYAADNLDYQLKIEQFEEKDASLRKNNFENNNFESKQLDYKLSKDKLIEHLKESSQGFFRKNISDSVKNMAGNFSSDIKEVFESKNKLDKAERDLDKISSDQMLEYVINSFKSNLDEAQDKLVAHLDDYWKEKEVEFKRSLLQEVSKSNALTETQHDELANIIKAYDVSSFKNQAEQVFEKKKYFRWTILGLRLSSDEKLDIRRLRNNYNYTIKKSVKDLAQKMNKWCYELFLSWGNRLLSEIDVKLVSLNPDLSRLAAEIKLENENIEELENNHMLIRDSFGNIERLISWNEVEGE